MLQSLIKRLHQLEKTQLHFRKLLLFHKKQRHNNPNHPQLINILQKLQIFLKNFLEKRSQVLTGVNNKTTINKSKQINKHSPHKQNYKVIGQILLLLLGVSQALITISRCQIKVILMVELQITMMMTLST